MPSSVPSLVVHKFGGAALADANAIAHAGDLLTREAATEGRVIVTSALQGVTNLLLEAVAHAVGDRRAAAARVVESISDRHLEVARALLPNSVHHAALDDLLEVISGATAQLAAGLNAIASDPDAAAALTDAVLAHGERMAAQLFRAMLSSRGSVAVVVDGATLIATDGRHGNAAPDLEGTGLLAAGVVLPLLARGQTVVVPGFIGAGREGAVVTLGRGGSDLTATVLARALSAREVTLWKDVAGCMTADPRIVPEARVVATLDAREASELAYYGARILHPRTLSPLRTGMTLRLRPFADPAASGTTIVVGRVARGAPVRAIAGIAAQSLVAVNGTGMLGVPGVAARVFGTLAAARVSVSMISQASSEQSICFSIPGSQAAAVVKALHEEFAEELSRGEVENIVVRANLTTVAVVGSGMARTPGISSRIFGAVAHSGVNVVAIAQGASERNVSFVVAESEATAAVRAVHRAFRLDKVGGGRASPRTEPFDVILLGMGRVARELVVQLEAARTRGAALRIVGLIDRAGFVFNARGVPLRQLHALMLRKQRGASLATMPGGRAATAAAAVEFMATHALARAVLVDVASGDTMDALMCGASHDMDLVLANKSPLAAELSTSRALFSAARTRRRRVLHEATVGAGLPIIDTLQQLHASGDRVDSVDSSPSGTMGFLFSEMGRGRSFSAAVLDAMSRGYTEPDPRDDLCGLDVARKGIILARMIGYTGEMTDVSLESLVPSSLRDVTPDQFLASLSDCDAEWAQRVADARARGEVMRYRARSTRGGVRVGLVSVPNGSALASLDGTDNLFVFTTARYRHRPLVVSGPGAGAAVTAAGVLGDVLRLATAR